MTSAPMALWALAAWWRSIRFWVALLSWLSLVGFGFAAINNLEPGEPVDLDASGPRDLQEQRTGFGHHPGSARGVRYPRGHPLAVRALELLLVRDGRHHGHKPMVTVPAPLPSDHPNGLMVAQKDGGPHPASLSPGLARVTAPPGYARNPLDHAFGSTSGRQSPQTNSSPSVRNNGLRGRQHRSQCPA